MGGCCVATDCRNGRFLSSNVNITVEEDGKAVSVPISNRYAKFETKMGRRVTAFGVIFNCGWGVTLLTHSQGACQEPDYPVANEDGV